MAGGVFLPFGISLVVRAGSVKVPVTRMEMKLLERRVQSGSGVFPEGILSFALGEGVIELAQVCETAGAFEALEISRAFGSLVIGMVVKIL